MKMITKLIGLYLNILALIAPKKAGMVGFKLFCYPFRGKITERHHQFFKTANRFTIEHENETIQVYKWGNGVKNILLLHGWQSHTYRWKSYVELLDKNEYTIYSIDAPGHGQSTGRFMTVPVYSGVVQKLILTIGSLHAVVGHSLGGFVALYTFHNYPVMAPGKLVSLASPGKATEFFDFYKMKLGLSEKCVKLIVNRFEEIVKKSPSYFSASDFANSITFQGLIIHDEEDDETPVEGSKAIHQSWKNSILVLTKGKGHNLKSSEVIHGVIDFINQPNNDETVKESLQKISLN